MDRLKLLLFAVLVLACAALWAAPTAKGPYQSAVNLPVVGAEPQTYFGPAEEASVRLPVNSLDDPVGTLYQAGTTWYDYQHNGSAGKMIGVDNDGFVHLVWMKGFTSNYSGTRHVYYQVWDPTTQSMEFLSGGQPVGVQINSSLRGGYICQAVNATGWAFPAFHETRSGVTGNHSSAAMDFAPRLGAFTTTQPAYIYEGGSPLELVWPKIAMGRDSVLHMVSTHSATTPSYQRIYYSRGIPQWDNSGFGLQVNWQTVAPGNAQFRLMDTTMTISADVAASKVSNRVAIAYSRPRHALSDTSSQYDNDIYLIISSDGGLTWGPRTDITQFTLQDTLRAYADVSLLFDANDVLHVAFTTTGYYADQGTINAQASLIWHWDELHQEFSALADGWEFSPDAIPGAWQRIAQRPSLCQDLATRYLYCSYQKYDITAPSEGGFLQGDAWVTVSTDGGLHWSTGRNVTDSRPAVIPTPAGQCLSERDITLADHVTYAGGIGYLSLEYVLDLDAGGIPQNEGVATNSPVYYQRVSVNDIPTTPLMPFIPFHNGQVPPPTLGRCCYGNSINPYCSMLTQAQCAQYAGAWDSTLSCATPCPSSFVCTCQNQPYTHCNLTGGAIPDGNSAGADFVIHVPTQYHITDLNVCLDIAHTNDVDLVISLRSPAGHTAVLASRQGAQGYGFTCTTFDDEAIDSIGGGYPPFRGSFMPETPLSVFDGENAMGDWILHVVDAFQGNSGRLNWVCLSFQYDEILPVELASVNAVAEQGGIRLHFATASESRNDHFDILRSTSADGEFSRIASIHSHGNSSAEQHYEYLDANVVAGTTYYYYLVDVSLNGDRREHRDLMRSATALSTPIPLEYSLSIYPNPFNPTTTVSFSLKEAARVRLTVYDVTGRRVQTLADKPFDAGAHEIAFDASALPAGIYFARIESASFTQTRKMVLLK